MFPVMSIFPWFVLTSSWSNRFVWSEQPTLLVTIVGNVRENNTRQFFAKSVVLNPRWRVCCCSTLAACCHVFCSFLSTVLFLAFHVMFFWRFVPSARVQATPRREGCGRGGDGEVAAAFQCSSSSSSWTDWRTLSLRFPLEMWEGAISFFRAPSSSACTSSSP